MAKVELKQPIVQAIADDVKDAASVVLVDYRGLTVAQDTELRKQLREAGIIYKVCKNTMMKRAFEGTELAALDEHLEGPSAIAISKDDATAPARILLANSITLTPGTITVLLEEDEYVVHCLDKSLAEGINSSIFVSMLRKMERMD